MAYQIGDKVSFKVNEVKSAGGNLYFVIKPDGFEQDVKAFDFQRGLQLPFMLDCYCRAVKESGEPVFFQDIARVIPQLYKIGQVYEFRVKNEVTQAGYYEVVDNNGLVFRLTDFGKSRLHVNQVVTCRVKSIKLVRMELQLESEESDRGIPFYDFDKGLELAGASGHERMLKLIFSRAPMFAEAFRQYQNENALWVITALEAADRYMSDWLTNRYISKRQILKWLESACIALLEQSDYLSSCTEREGFEYQEKLSRFITHFQDYIEAIDLVDQRKDTAYISDLLERLKLTGYLYKPEKRMRVAMAIFSMQRKNVSHFIRDIFDIIRQSHGRRRFMHQFATAFTELLDAYITNESKVVDVFTTDSDQEALNQMVAALALRLLLSKITQDENNPLFLLYRSMLYRYATLVTENNPQVLLHKARIALLGFAPDNLEFSWPDLANVRFLCAKLGYDSGIPSVTEARIFEGNNAMILIDGQQISVMPLQHGTDLYEAAGKDMFQEMPIRVLLNDKSQERPTMDIEQLHRMWNEIEASLFDANPAFKAPVFSMGKVKPKVGDIVPIRVLKPTFNDKFSYICIIEDDEIEGEGTLAMRQVVKYNIKTTAADFVDPVTKAPYLLSAKIIGIDPSGKYRFSLLEPLGKFLSDNLVTGSLVLGEVIKVEPYYSFAVSEEGYALYIPTNDIADVLCLGDKVEVKIDAVNNEGNVRVAFQRKVYNEAFQQHDAFLTLIREYAGGKTYSAPVSAPLGVPTSVDDDEQGGAKSADSFLESDYMRELIHLVDRQALLCRDYLITYNFLALAKIFSRMISDAISVEYFSKRMALVEQIQQFGVNESLDEQKLDLLLKENREFMEVYPDIKNKMLQLKSISLLGKAHDWDFLYRTSTDDTHPVERDVARYVLSYNMLENANMHDALKAVLRKIYQTMELNRKLPQSNYVGAEDQFTELKASLIFPADRGNHMMANEKVQISKIMKVVASMLNSKGGRLYIGVNDGGYAIGLHNDFTYLNSRHPDYDLMNVKDKFDRKLRDSVHNMLGHEANSLVEGTFETIGDNVIYRVDISPSSSVVYLEQIAYERQGSSIWPVDKELLPAFIEKRKREFGD